MLHVKKSKFENIRKIESIFIQEPEELFAEKSYFPAFAVSKLNTLVITEENKFSTITISAVFGSLSKYVRNDLHCSQFFDSKKLKLIFNLFTLKFIVETDVKLGNVSWEL